MTEEEGKGIKPAKILVWGTTRVNADACDGLKMGGGRRGK